MKKKTLFEANHSLHLYDLASCPLGKMLSRTEQTSDAQLEAMLHLFGFDLETEWFEEPLDPEALRRSDFTKEIFKGGSLFVGRKREDDIWKQNGLRNLHTFCFGDKVNEMFDLIVGKEKVVESGS